MRKMQQRKRNVLRKKTGRLSVLFDEREWGGSQRQEDWQARSGLWKRRCNGVDNDLAGLGCEGSAVLIKGCTSTRSIFFPQLASPYGGGQEKPTIPTSACPFLTLNAMSLFEL
jgi:hypothetical protein